MTIAFIGLGSNMHTPEQQVGSALEELERLEDTEIVEHSSLYRSKPVGPQDQADFINAVAKLETQLTPIQLLDAMQALENKHERKRELHWGPRTLDLDILAYGNDVIDSARLSVPHPEIANRSFVLIPWAEIDPDWEIVGLGRVHELIGKLEDSSLEILP